MAEMDFVRLDKFLLLRNMVGLDFGRLDSFELLRIMVKMDFGGLNNMYHFVTWYNWVLVDWPVFY